MDVLKRWVRRRLEAAGYVVFNPRTAGLYAQDGLFTFNNSHFAQDPAFQAAYRRGIQASHGVDPRIEWRAHVALWAATCAARVPGDFVECGVNAGFLSSAIMRHLDWRRVEKTFYLIDTFRGPILSQYSEEEVRRGRRRVAEEALSRGAYVTDLDAVRANYAEWPNARIVQGTVPDILERLPMSRVAFLHLDMNCASPERAAFEYFWEKMSPGGIILLDDYAMHSYDALAEAIDGAAKARAAEVLSLPTGQGVVWKPR